jgi:Tol biopolymer transport system component
LRDTEGLIFLSSFSQGRLVYFQTNSTGSEIFTARVSESNGELNADTPELFFMSQFREQRPHLSLDGQWMAYSSDKIGPQFDVFVRAFPQPRSSQVELRISDNGGDVARWTRDGKLLYQSGDQILSVGYSVREESFVKGQQRVRVEKLRGTDWDVAPDGRIAVVTPIETEAPAAEHTLVFLYNFFDQLRRQVPGR